MHVARVSDGTHVRAVGPWAQRWEQGLLLLTAMVRTRAVQACVAGRCFTGKRANWRHYTRHASYAAPTHPLQQRMPTAVSAVAHRTTAGNPTDVSATIFYEDGRGDDPHVQLNCSFHSAFRQTVEVRASAAGRGRAAPAGCRRLLVPVCSSSWER